MTAVYPWQDALWQDLLADRQRLPHALLLTGRRGIGKRDFGLALARALLCQAPTAQHMPCETCEACRWFEAAAHPDFRLIEPQTEDGEAAATQIKIDQIREVDDFVSLSSHQHGLRILLVCPAENMNVNAANALLKTLEEPPAGTILILVAHRPGLLPATILSRCSKIAMPQPDQSQTEAWLANAGIEDAAMLVAYTGNSPLLAVTEGQQRELVAKRLEMVEALLSAERMDPLSLAAALEKMDRSMVVEWLMKALHDLLAAMLVGRVRYYPQLSDVFVQAAKTADRAGLLALQNLINESAATATHPLNAQLFYERLLFAWQQAVHPGRQAA